MKNNLLKKNTNNNTLLLSRFVKNSYGYGFNMHKTFSNKMNLSNSFIKVPTVAVVSPSSSGGGSFAPRVFLDLNFRHYDRLLKLKDKNRLENTKKQSSWKGLRLRQGLPLNGQRTHTNARTAKKLLPSIINLLS